MLIAEAEVYPVALKAPRVAARPTRRFALSAIAIAALALPRHATAQMIPDGTLAHGTLSFDANATLGAFTGITHEMTGRLGGAATLAGVHGWVESKTATLTTNNGHRDRDMATSLDTSQYPTMRFDLDSIAVAGAPGDSTPVTLHGHFTIHGTTKAADIAGWITTAADSARFRGSTVMDVKDYGVGHLSKALGILRMNEHIVVHVDVTFALHR